MIVFEAYPNCFKELITNPEICTWWWPVGEDLKVCRCRKWRHQDCPTGGRKPVGDVDARA